jgi:hypothetical protein
MAAIAKHNILPGPQRRGKLVNHISSNDHVWPGLAITRLKARPGAA